jgi:hypothetical protein
MHLFPGEQLALSSFKEASTGNLSDDAINEKYAKGDVRRGRRGSDASGCPALRATGS